MTNGRTHLLIERISIVWLLMSPNSSLLVQVSGGGLFLGRSAFGFPACSRWRRLFGPFAQCLRLQPETHGLLLWDGWAGKPRLWLFLIGFWSVSLIWVLRYHLLAFLNFFPFDFLFHRRNTLRRWDRVSRNFLPWRNCCTHVIKPPFRAPTRKSLLVSPLEWTSMTDLVCLKIRTKCNIENRPNFGDIFRVHRCRGGWWRIALSFRSSSSLSRHRGRIRLSLSPGKVIHDLFHLWINQSVK